MIPRRGLCIGKFLPPHRGHHHLFATAARGCAELTIIVCAKPTDPIPGDTRAEWIREAFPAADVRVIDDRYDEQDSRVWAENTVRWLDGPPDAVFTSEAYGEPYARLMGCRHVSVDPARAAVPVSGTAIRRDPLAHWDFLPPPARAWYARRVVVLGAESTGTTTLARDLAEALGTVWVPEYGREYSEVKLHGLDPVWRTEEFTAIAREQNRREYAAARACNRVLVCDTDSFATRLWHRRYVGYESPDVAALSATRKADLYLLTGDEIPFVQDGLRDGEHIRHEMHRWFEQALAAQPVPWVLLRGGREERCNAALALVRDLLSSASLFT